MIVYICHYSVIINILDISRAFIIRNMQDSEDIEERADTVFNNLISSALQYSGMHMHTYRILSAINNLYIGLLIMACIVTSILSIVNTKHQFSDPSTYSAIIEILIATALSLYKYTMLPERVQSHYHYYNEFQILYMRLNTMSMVIGTPHSIYINKYEAIRDVTEKCDLLLRDAPAFPWYIKRVVKRDTKSPDTIIKKIIDNDASLSHHKQLNEIFYST